jgi:hypothetical protein
MMMPIIMNDINSLPAALSRYKRAVAGLFNMSYVKKGVGYLTIDERDLSSGESLRRPGLHVDGIYKDGAGGWGGGAPWAGKGMITVSNPAGCRAWNQTFNGWPKSEGECEHLHSQAHPESATTLQPNTAYWMNPLCVHESLPMEDQTERGFMRLSMPSHAPWFVGYTRNPLGVQPTGPILPRRSFQKSEEVVSI